ncbi:MAG TPA: TIR domain-containing protein [Flavobacterium sp.]|uniref:TIR domain-containing protein n=1 Tax=Flavobacterium sp. TaxID=239 RepID=UPI002DBACAC0|nr:TIR domain-containing protein [Flavobacterium sp.]HEU4791754.1 TIR domain-containing protein [Flavobacterium sp.]
MLPLLILGGVITYLITKNNSSTKNKKKRIFISFAIEDKTYRDHLKEQSKNEKSPFDFIDMSVKKEWEQAVWKDKCRTRIKSCDGVIALLSKNTHKASGARWEMKCAIEEGKKIIGMHIKKMIKDQFQLN